MYYGPLIQTDQVLQSFTPGSWKWPYINCCQSLIVTLSLLSIISLEQEGWYDNINSHMYQHLDWIGPTMRQITQVWLAGI